MPNYKSLVANGIVWCDNAALTIRPAVKNWFGQRLTGLPNQLATVASPFSINSTIVSNVCRAGERQPLQLRENRLVQGAAWPVIWTTVTNWTATVVLPLRHQ